MNASTRPALLPAALVAALSLGACNRWTDDVSRQATDIPEAHVEATPLPPTVEPVVVQGPEADLDWSIDGVDAVATRSDDAEGYAAALEYMGAERAGSPREPETAGAGPTREAAQRAVADVSHVEPPPGATAEHAAPRTESPIAAPARGRPSPGRADDPPARRVAGAAPVPTTGDARSLNSRAIALINAGRPEPAIPLLERAVAQEPRDAEILGNLGYAHMLAGEHRRARDRLRTALDLAPTRSATWLNLGQTYAELGQRDIAVDAVVTGYRYSSRKASVRSALARAASSDRHSAAWREAAALALSRIG